MQRKIGLENGSAGEMTVHLGLSELPAPAVPSNATALGCFWTAGIQVGSADPVTNLHKRLISSVQCDSTQIFRLVLDQKAGQKHLWSSICGSLSSFCYGKATPRFAGDTDALLCAGPHEDTACTRSRRCTTCSKARPGTTPWLSHLKTS